MFKQNVILIVFQNDKIEGYYWTIGGFFVAFQYRWSIYQSKGRRKVSRYRYGWTLLHASDARYSASNCQKRTYNFILSTITRFIMVGLGLFLDQCVLHVQAHQNNTKYEKSPKKIFFWFLTQRGDPWKKMAKLTKKNFLKKFFTATYTLNKHVIRCVYTCRTHWSRKNPNPTIMKRVMVIKNVIIGAFLTIWRAISPVRRVRQSSSISRSTHFSAPFRLVYRSSMLEGYKKTPYSSSFPTSL